MNKLLYNALMLGRNKNIANEEFLVAEGKKEPAAFRVIEEQIDIEEVTADTFFELHLEQTKEGYLEIEIYCSDECIELDRKIVTSEDFKDGKLTVPVRIPVNKTHNGKNFSQIVFRTSVQDISVPVTIDNKIKVVAGPDSMRKILKELEENYLALRMNRMDSREWIEKGLELLNDIYGADRQSLYLMLYRAQLYIMKGTAEKAFNIMDFVSEQLPKLSQPDYVLSCYYIYIRSLYNMDDRQTEEAVDKVRLVHMRIPHWKILWMLFFMDYRYKDDPERKLAEIEAVCEKGCTSPEMYFEAVEIFRARPNLLRAVSDFELQVLNFSAKYKLFNQAMVDRLPELIFSLSDKELREVNIGLALKILKAFYKEDPSSSVLKAICALVIFTRDKSCANHEYFKKAVREAFSLSGLYEYYVFTSDKTKMEAFPNKVLDYFAESADSLMQDRSYFYANIIKNRFSHPDRYRAYLNNILSYAENCLESGEADDFLGIICEEILSNGLATRRIEQNLFSIICRKKITCRNPRMMSVLVFHRELSLYQDVFLENGQAYVNIYSGSALVLFKDITGNIYKNIEYEKTDLINTGEYIDVCIKEAPINRYMILEDTLPLLRAYKDPVDILQYLSNQLSTGLLRAEYEKRLMREAVISFSKTKDIGVYDELLEFRKFNLDEETRGKLIEIMIARTLYKQAFEAIGKYGFRYVSDEAIAKLAHVMVNLSNYKNADPLLLSLCTTAFRKTAFDQDIFDYLVSFTTEDLSLMVELYRAAAAYDKNPGEIAQRILSRAVETRQKPDGIANVFAKYYEKGEDEQLKDDYLTFRAIDYLEHQGKAEKEFFKFLETGFIQKKVYDVRVYAAYLYYMTGVPSPGITQHKVVENILKDLARRGIMLEKFKELRANFTLPSALANSVIANCFVSDSAKVPVITYRIEPDKEEDEQEAPAEAGQEGMEEAPEKLTGREEEMSRLFEGCYAKYFNLFTGERVRYQIDNGPIVTVRYEELQIQPDESRFSDLDRLIKQNLAGQDEELKEAARAYYVKDKLIDRIFNSEGR